MPPSERVKRSETSESGKPDAGWGQESDKAYGLMTWGSYAPYKCAAGPQIERFDLGPRICALVLLIWGVGTPTPKIRISRRFEAPATLLRDCHSNMAGYRRSYSTRASRGNMRSAAQQRDCADFVIKVQTPIGLDFGNKSDATGQVCLLPILGGSSQYK